MKRIASLAVIALLAAVLVGQAQVKDEYWKNVPENQKTEISIYSYGGYLLNIQCFLSTRENWRLFWGSQWADQQEITEIIQKAIETTFPGRTVLFVAIANGAKSQYFWPTNIVFTQGYNQYSATYKDILPLSKDEPFAGGEMKPYVVTQGFIAIPERIDVTRSFKVWYEDEYGIIKAGVNSP